MTVKCINNVEGAPSAIGPYSQATSNGSLVFFSGQVPIDPATGKVVDGGIEEQTAQVLKNLAAVLEGAGCKKTDILKAGIFMTDLADFGKVNELYGEWLGDHRPARATVQVAALPLGVQVEIDLIATTCS
jgi:2-iminobutanoate/2-iminopropanoate deaminase